MNVARNKGEPPITHDELVMRRELGRVYRARRDGAGLTQAEVGRRLDPHYERANTWVSNFEAAKGNYSIWFGVQLAKAIDPAWSLGKALIETGDETGTLDHVNTITALEADTRLRLPVRRALIAGVQREYEDYEAERTSPHHRAKVRDDKTDEPVTPAAALEVLTEGWSKEEREQLERAVRRIERARRAEPTETPKKRKRTNDDG